MSPRRLHRRFRAFRWQEERRQDREERRFFNTLNAAGLAFHGKDWNWISSEDARETEDFEERWERAERQEERYINHLHGE